MTPGRDVELPTCLADRTGNIRAQQSPIKRGGGGIEYLYVVALAALSTQQKIKGSMMEFNASLEEVLGLKPPFFPSD